MVETPVRSQLCGCVQYDVGGVSRGSARHKLSGRDVVDARWADSCWKGLHRASLVSGFLHAFYIAEK